MFRLILLPLFGVLIYYALSKNVIEMTDEDFAARIKEEETALVMFSASWCGYCKRMWPEFEKAAGELRSSEWPVRLVKVDCAGGGRQTCKEFSISGFPTLKVFKSGVPGREYEGGSRAADIVAFVRRHAGPGTRPLPDKQALDHFLQGNELCVVGFFEEGSKMIQEFSDVAETLREHFRFGVMTTDLGEHANKVVLFRPKHLSNKFEPESVAYDGDIHLGLSSFLKKNKHGLVGHRTKENEEDFRKPLVVAYYEVDFIKNPKGTNYWRNRILSVAQSFSEDFNFAISDIEEFQKELNDFGFDFTPTKKPVVFVRSKNKKFRMEDEFSADNFQKFLTDLKEDKIEPYVKSEPVPEKNDGPVKVAVGRNFDEVVINNNKDTLVKFYAPWCVHCKDLAPVFEDLGKALADEDVEIVKMDGTRNEIPPGYEFRGYPTIFWAPRDSKSSPVMYDGRRQLQDLIKYVAQHATSDLKHFDRAGNKIKEEL